MCHSLCPAHPPSRELLGGGQAAEGACSPGLGHYPALQLQAVCEPWGSSFLALEGKEEGREGLTLALATANGGVGPLAEPRGSQPWWKGPRHRIRDQDTDGTKSYWAGLVAHDCWGGA